MSPAALVRARGLPDVTELCTSPCARPCVYAHTVRHVSQTSRAHALGPGPRSALTAEQLRLPADTDLPAPWGAKLTPHSLAAASAPSVRAPGLASAFFRRSSPS